MDLPIPLDFAPMEAELDNELPDGEGWLYEPKWDGFRCLAFRAGDEIELQSKAGKPLARYFPDLVEVLASIPAQSFVLDGEIVISVDGALSFDDLLQRIHPAESRVRKLAAEYPADYILFDLLVDAGGRDLTSKPLAERRRALEAFSDANLGDAPRLHISPATSDLKMARKWLQDAAIGLDGVMAKQQEAPYASGERTAMRKVKRQRTAECVVGGFRWGKGGKQVGSLLLGLYGDDGLLHHVGYCSALNAARKAEAKDRVTAEIGGEGFTGSAPGGPSRWRSAASAEWEALHPNIVVEVQYDHFSQGRFRHGTRFLRWRPDKDPRQCRLTQVEREAKSAIGMI